MKLLRRYWAYGLLGLMLLLVAGLLLANPVASAWYHKYTERLLASELGLAAKLDRLEVDIFRPGYTLHGVSLWRPDHPGKGEPLIKVARVDVAWDWRTVRDPAEIMRELVVRDATVRIHQDAQGESDLAPFWKAMFRQKAGCPLEIRALRVENLQLVVESDKGLYMPESRFTPAPLEIQVATLRAESLALPLKLDGAAEPAFVPVVVEGLTCDAPLADAATWFAESPCRAEGLNLERAQAEWRPPAQDDLNWVIRNVKLDGLAFTSFLRSLHEPQTLDRIWIPLNILALEASATAYELRAEDGPAPAGHRVESLEINGGVWAYAAPGGNREPSWFWLEQPRIQGWDLDFGSPRDNTPAGKLTLSAQAFSAEGNGPVRVNLENLRGPWNAPSGQVSAQAACVPLAPFSLLAETDPMLQIKLLGGSVQVQTQGQVLDGELDLSGGIQFSRSLLYRCDNVAKQFVLGMLLTPGSRLGPFRVRGSIFGPQVTLEGAPNFGGLSGR